LYINVYNCTHNVIIIDKKAKQLYHREDYIFLGGENVRITISPYEILDIDPSDLSDQDEKATKKIINAAYMAKVRKLHPDITGIDTPEVHEKLTELLSARDKLVKDPLNIDRDTLRGGQYSSKKGKTLDEELSNIIDDFLMDLPEEMRDKLAGSFQALLFQAQGDPNALDPNDRLGNPYTALTIFGIGAALHASDERSKDRKHIEHVATYYSKQYIGKVNISDKAKAKFNLFKSQLESLGGQSSTMITLPVPRSSTEKELIARILDLENMDFEALAELIEITDFNTAHGSRLFTSPRAGEPYFFMDAINVQPPDIKEEYGWSKTPSAEHSAALAIVRKTDPNSAYGLKVIQDIVSYSFADPEYVYRGRTPSYNRDVGERVRAEIISKTDFNTLNGVKVVKALIDSGSLSSGNTGLQAVGQIVSKCSNPSGRIQEHETLSLLGEAGLIDLSGKAILPRDPLVADSKPPVAPLELS
jgi:hypothetical protein